MDALSQELQDFLIRLGKEPGCVSEKVEHYIKHIMHLVYADEEDMLQQYYGLFGKDVKPLEEVPNAYWAVPLALRKRSTARRLQSPMKSVERARLIESIVNLRAKLNSEAEELEALELRRDQMPTQEQLNEHMQRLHKYNENKDIGQELMGKLAEIEKEKVEVMYEKYGIELDD